MNGFIFILVDKQLADVVLDLDQIRPSLVQRGRKSGEPGELLQGEKDLANGCSVSNIYFWWEII